MGKFSQFARRHSLCLSTHATRFHFWCMLLCFELLFLSEFHLLFCFDLIHTFFNGPIGFYIESWYCSALAGCCFWYCFQACSLNFSFSNKSFTPFFFWCSCLTFQLFVFLVNLITLGFPGFFSKQ